MEDGSMSKPIQCIGTGGADCPCGPCAVRELEPLMVGLDFDAYRDDTEAHRAPLPADVHDMDCGCPECFPVEEPTEAERREGEERAELMHRRAHGVGSL
jgi:hypothetical protein